MSQRPCGKHAEDTTAGTLSSGRICHGKGLRLGPSEKFIPACCFANASPWVTKQRTTVLAMAAAPLPRWLIDDLGALSPRLASSARHRRATRSEEPTSPTTVVPRSSDTTPKESLPACLGPVCCRPSPPKSAPGLLPHTLPLSRNAASGCGSARESAELMTYGACNWSERWHVPQVTAGHCLHVDFPGSHYGG